jgi:predicted NBD/HSP70 family sugar kinase
LLRLVHAEPGITRAAARERLGLASGAAAELIERLRDAHLIAEHRAQPEGPGRPTTVFAADEEGPLVAVVEMRSAGWSLAVGDFAGELRDFGGGAYADGAPGEFLPQIARSVSDAAQAHPGRIRAVVAAVGGTVSGTRLLQFSTRGWDEVDLSVLTSGFDPGEDAGLLVGNDATLGGIAEARHGAAVGVRTALHILVAVGVGGVLLVDGQPVTGTRGAGGEYGHLPFGEADLACPCGAKGCWDLMVDGRALARHRGDEAPADPFAYARQVLGRLTRGRASARDVRAVGEVARALGAGIGGLANLHDPDVITLAGLGPDLRAAAPAAFATGYWDALMTFHRADPPPILDALHGTDGPVRGALTLGFDTITTPESLSRWAEVRAGRGG